MALWQVLGLMVLTAISAGIGSGTNAIAALFTVVFFISAVALYFAPTITAAKREHPNKNSIIALNVLLGWTVLGWVASLVWAYSAKSHVVAEIATPPTATPVEPVALPVAASVADELKKLVQLREEGILTPDEFQEQKAALLARSRA